MQTSLFGTILRRIRGLSQGEAVSKRGRWMAASLAFVASTCVSGLGLKAIAAESVVILVSGGSRTIPVVDLETFAETGELSRQLNIYINDYLDAEDSETYRDLLNFEVQLNFAKYARFVQSEAGECLQSVLARAIKPNPTDSTASLSIRAGLINGAAPDGRLTVMDLIRSYPNSKLHVDTNEISGSSGILDDAWDDWRSSVEQAGVPLDENIVETQSSVDLTGIDYDILEMAARDLFCERLAVPGE